VELNVTRGQRERPPSATDSDADTGIRGDTLLTDPAPLTLTDDRVMTCGGGVPALTRRHTGLAHGASASPAGGPATGATSGGTVGTYDITQGTLAGTGNYTIATFDGGTPAANRATPL
jgi:hypothetical protein